MLREGTKNDNKIMYERESGEGDGEYIEDRDSVFLEPQSQEGRTGIPAHP
jgi:hypothetical protein